MRDAAVISGPATQQFATANALGFFDEPPALLAPMRLHPSEERALAVAGTWRDRQVQRFVTPHYVIATMGLPAQLPLLQLMPRVPGYEMETLYGQEFRTGDEVLDARWRFAAEDLTYAGTVLSNEIREVLRHDAALGAAVVIDGAVLYHWQPIPLASLTDARTHLELLAALTGRIGAATWQTYGVPLALPVVPVLAEDPSAAPAAPTGAIPPVPPSSPYPPVPSVTFAAPEATESSVALSAAGMFIPEGDDDAAPTDSGWIGGDEVDQSHMFYTGPRLKGQARPRV